jgi:hypothetical protein
VVQRHPIPFWSWLVLIAVIIGLLVWRLGPPSLSLVNTAWAGVATAWNNFWSLKPETQISAFQLTALVVGGLWVFILYHRRREGQATVRIASAVRSAPAGSGAMRLFVRTHIANESAVVVKAIEATMTLLGVRPAPQTNQLILTRIAAQDLFLPVNGELDVDQTTQEATFKPEAGATLEPGECVESEVVFDVTPGTGDWVAVRCQVEGEQDTLIPHWWGLPKGTSGQQNQPWGIRFREQYVWGSYAMVDLSNVAADYATITLHDRLTS